MSSFQPCLGELMLPKHPHRREGFETLSLVYGRQVVRIGTRASGVEFGATPLLRKGVVEAEEAQAEYERWLERARQRGVVPPDARVYWPEEDRDA